MALFDVHIAISAGGAMAQGVRWLDTAWGCGGLARRGAEHPGIAAESPLR